MSAGSFSLCRPPWYTTRPRRSRPAAAARRGTGVASTAAPMMPEHAELERADRLGAEPIGRGHRRQRAEHPRFGTVVDGDSGSSSSSRLTGEHGVVGGRAGDARHHAGLFLHHHREQFAHRGLAGALPKLDEALALELAAEQRAEPRAGEAEWIMADAHRSRARRCRPAPGGSRSARCRRAPAPGGCRGARSNSRTARDWTDVSLLAAPCLAIPLWSPVCPPVGTACGQRLRWRGTRSRRCAAGGRARHAVRLFAALALSPASRLAGRVRARLRCAHEFPRGVGGRDRKGGPTSPPFYFAQALVIRAAGLRILWVGRTSRTAICAFQAGRAWNSLESRSSTYHRSWSRCWRCSACVHGVREWVLSERTIARSC